MAIEAVRNELAKFGQEHLLAFWDELNEPSRNQLLGQINELNLAYLDQLAKEYVLQKPTFELTSQPRPPVVHPPAPRTPDQQDLYRRAEDLGEQMLRDGKVAAFVVAGGQGTRLGYDGPKGCFPATPIRRKPLFQVFAEFLTSVGQRFGKPVPWYVMTSPPNDAATRAFFREHQYFGLNESDVFFFVQGTMPAFDRSGKILLAAKDELALSPDGHGGSLLALRRSGALADMTRRGVEVISYFQVDNPCVYCVHPLFVGLHAITGSEMSSKSLPKAFDKEKLGNFAVLDGKLCVIEYSDLPDELAAARNPDGSRVFDAGSIAIHALDRSFVERLTADAGKLNLPWHRADKKIAHIDPATGEKVEPKEPNGVKLEAFVFDAIPLAANPLVFETVREDEFAPIKNAEGGDSPATSRVIQISRAATWLEAAGVSIPRHADGTPNCVIEMSPLYATQKKHVTERVATKPVTVPAGAEMVLE